jgi:tetratricopeptide (TPR) repeat protein
MNIWRENMADEDAEYWNNKGNEFSYAKNFEKAVKCYEKAAEKAPDNAVIFINWGHALSDLAKTKQDETLHGEAIKKYEQAAEKAPDNAVVFFKWGNALSDLAKIKQDETLYGEAIKKYEQAAEKDPDDANTFFYWGNALVGLAKIKRDETLYREAFKKFEQATEKTPDDAIVFLKWGNALFDLAEIKQEETLYGEAIKKYEQAAEKAPDDAVVFFNWGYALADLAKIKQDETLYGEAIKKYEQAAEKAPDNAVVFNNWGNALSDLAKIKDDETLYGEAFKKYEQAAEKTPDDAVVFFNWVYALSDLAKIKQDETLYGEAFKKYEQAAEKAPDDAVVFNNWGYTLSDLAKIKQDETLYREAIKKYEQVAEKAPDNAVVFTNWGYVLADLAEITHDKNITKTLFEEFYRESDSFKKLNKDILGICIIFNKNKMREIINDTKIFFPLLDLNNGDGLFFNEIKKGITNTKKLNKYKEAYILSILIISQLHINNKNEKMVSYYTNKTVSQGMLFNDIAFRLNSINYSNDPTEGKILLDYLFKERKYSPKELNTGYGAFAGCFTFNHDSLNQFRLYGKEDDREGTGLSLVFKDSFFSINAKMATKQEQNSVSVEDKQQQHALFRCIYIDPVTRRVETVGHKEEYLFYRENIAGEIKKYRSDIEDIIKSVKYEMKELQKLVKGLEPEVIGQLLINLRYLIKHIAFKEEQECRIIKIHRLNDKETVKINPVPDNENNIQIDNIKRLYIDYQNIIGKVEKIYFGPNASQMELFMDLLRYKGQNIPCERSKNPLSK